ncbi:diguanylate cyclase domain-containing protein [Alkalibacterium olivapovliticus]|uniref:Diguanylate cyclase (GGDEF)-like protein n=1 Tax=Alkalibacterium olivapovliticus TaxID=99907 RepID=A0A2T0W739_9LACT|nr:diguanylate cyclase [Alkalibacterium olivapovliticus]PRY82512.1 diguanylate cyclase (GGDEF)-like protein [Alkalibacterium olivapovliticus]
MKKWVIAFIVATFAAVSLYIPVQLLRTEYNQQHYEEQRSQARDHLTMIRENLQSELDDSLIYVDFFEMVIRQNPAITEPELREYGRFIVERNALIETVTVAKDGIVHFVYPSDGKELIMGLDMLNVDVEGLSAFDYTPTTISSVSRGPFDSDHEDVKVINHKPVFTESISADDFWGFASVTIDFEELIESTLSQYQHPDYSFAMRIDPANKHPFVWGDNQVFSEDHVLQAISLPNTHWNIGIAPVNGWMVRDSFPSFELIISYIMISIIFVLVYVFSVQYISKRDLSRTDALTNCLNKHTFEVSVKRVLKYSSLKNGILLIDINDFKKINDEHGHLAGDKVLIESARRMKEIIKSTDRVGRIGGDEFMIMVKDLQNEDDLEMIAKRIIAHMEQPVSYNSNQIDLTVSVGFMMALDTKAFDHIYDLVDKKMYKHKEGHKGSMQLELD